MPVSHNNMALSTSQDMLTNAMNLGQYPAVEVALASKVGDVSYGVKCVADAKEVLSKYLDDADRIGSSDQLLACIICNRLNPAKYPLPVKFSAMSATRDSLYVAVTQGAAGFNSGRADAVDVLTSAGRDSYGKEVDSFADRYIKPVAKLITDLGNVIPKFNDEEFSSIVSWYVFGYTLFKQRKATSNNKKTRATDIADVYDNYIDSNKGSLNNPNADTTGMTIVEVDVNNINTHTKLAPVKIEKLIMKVSGINFVDIVSERVSTTSKGKITSQINNNSRVYDALYELFTTSSSIRSIQRQDNYNSNSNSDDDISSDGVQLSLFEASDGTSKASMIDAIIERIGALPITQIEDIRDDLIARIEDVCYDHGIYDLDASTIKEIVFFGHENCLSENSNRGAKKNSLLLKKGKEFASKMSVVSDKPLTIQLEDHRVTIENPAELETEVYPYAIHGYLSLDQNESLIKVTGIIPFSYQNDDGELVQDLGESDEVTTFRGKLTDIKNAANAKHVGLVNTNRLHSAGFNNVLSGRDIADKIDVNINNVVDNYMQKYLAHAAKVNPDAPVTEEAKETMKVRYQGLIGKRVATAAAYMKSLDDSRQSLVKALSSKHRRSANTIFLKYFDKGHLIVNNATGNKSSIDVGEINQQKYEAIKLYAYNEYGDSVDEWDNKQGYLVKLTSINQELFNANRSISNDIGSIETIRLVSTKLVNTFKARGAETVSDAIQQITSSNTPVMDEKMKSIITKSLDNTERVLINMAKEGMRISNADETFVRGIAEIATEISDITNSDDYTGKNLEYILSLGGLRAENGPTMYATIKYYLNQLGNRAIQHTLTIPENILTAIDYYYDNLSHILSDVNNEGHKISGIVNDAYQIVCGDGLTGGVATSISSLANMFNEGTRIISGEIYATKIADRGLTEIPGDMLRPEEDMVGAIPDEQTIDNDVPSAEDEEAIENASYEQDFDHSFSDEFTGNSEQQSEGMIALRSIAAELDAEPVVSNAITLYDESNQFIKKYQNTVYDTKNRMVSSVEGIMYRTINLVMSELLDYVLDKPRVTSMETGASRLVAINEKLKEIASIYSNGRMNSRYVANRFNTLVNAFTSAAADMSGHEEPISTRDGQVNPIAANGILAILNVMDVLGQSIEPDAQDTENTLLNAAAGKNEHMRRDKITHFNGSSASLSDMTKSSSNLKDQYGHDSIVDAFARTIIAPPDKQPSKQPNAILSDATVNHFLALSRGMKEMLNADANLRNRAMSLGELFGRNDYAPTSSNRDENISPNAVDISRPDNLVNGTYMDGAKITDRMNVIQDINTKSAAQAWSKNRIKNTKGLIPNLYTGVAGNNVSLALINDIFDDERRFEGESYPTVINSVTNLLTGGDVTTYRKNVEPTESEPGADGNPRTMYNTKGSLVVVHSGTALTEEDICKECSVPSMPLTTDVNGTKAVTDESIKPFVIALRQRIVNQMIDTACNNWDNSSDSRLDHKITVNRNNPNSIYSDKAKFNAILKEKLGNQSASDTSIPLAELVVSLNPDVMSMALDRNAHITNSKATGNAGINSNQHLVTEKFEEMLQTLEPITENSSVTPEGLLVELAYAYASGDEQRIDDAKKSSDEAKRVMSMLKNCGIARTKLVDTVMSIYGAPIREHLDEARDSLGEVVKRLSEKFPDKKFSVNGLFNRIVREMDEDPEKVAAREASTEYPEYKDIIANIRATGVPTTVFINSSTGYPTSTFNDIINTFNDNDKSNDVSDNDEKLSEIVQPNTSKIINTDSGVETKNVVTDLSKAFITELRSGIGDSVRKLAQMGKTPEFIKNFIIRIAEDMGSSHFDTEEYIEQAPIDMRDIVLNIIETIEGIGKRYDYPIAPAKDSVDISDAIKKVLNYDSEHPEKAQIKHNGKLGNREMSIAVGKNVVDAEQFSEMFQYLYHKSIVDEIDLNTYQLYDTVEREPIKNKYINAYQLYTEVKKIASIQNTVHPDRVTELLFRYDMDTPSATPLLDDILYHILTNKVANAHDNVYSVNGSSLEMTDNQFIANVSKALNSVGKKISDTIKGLTSEDRQIIESAFVTEVKQSDKPRMMTKANMSYKTDDNKETLANTEVVDGKKVCGVCHGTGKVNGEICPQCKGMPNNVSFQKAKPDVQGDMDVASMDAMVQRMKDQQMQWKKEREQSQTGSTPLTESIAPEFWDHW